MSLAKKTFIFTLTNWALAKNGKNHYCTGKQLIVITAYSKTEALAFLQNNLDSFLWDGVSMLKVQEEKTEQANEIYDLTVDAEGNEVKKKAGSLEVKKTSDADLHAAAAEFFKKS